jgi:hypothetical protein
LTANWRQPHVRSQVRLRPEAEQLEAATVSPRRARHRERLPRSAGWQVDRVVVTDDDAVL